MDEILTFPTTRSVHERRQQQEENQLVQSALNYLIGSKYVSTNLRRSLLAEQTQISRNIQAIERTIIEDEGKYPVSIAKLLDELGYDPNKRRGFYKWLVDEGFAERLKLVHLNFTVVNATEKSIESSYARRFDESQNQWLENGLTKLLEQYERRSRG